MSSGLEAHVFASVLHAARTVAYSAFLLRISAHPQPNRSSVAVRGTLQAVLLARAPIDPRARLVNILAARMSVATPSTRTHGITNVVSRGRFSSMSSGGSRPSVAPRPPKLLVPKSATAAGELQLPKSLFSSPDDSTKLHSGPAVVAELERKLAESGDQHVFQRHAYVSALASIDSLDATLTMPYLIRMLAARQRFTEPTRLPHDSLDGRLQRSSHVVAFELLLDLAATQAGRRALTRHVLEIAAVAPAAPAPRQSSVGAGVPGRRTSRSWSRTRTAAAGGSWSSSSGASRRSTNCLPFDSWRPSTPSLMVDGGDVRAENERLRSESRRRARRRRGRSCRRAAPAGGPRER